MGRSTFGASFRKLRKQRHFKVKDLAQLFGCSPSLVYNIEAGINDPQAPFILRAADLFGVCTDELLRDDSDVAQTILLVNNEEEELVVAFRRLPSNIRQLVLQLVKTIQAECGEASD